MRNLIKFLLIVVGVLLFLDGLYILQNNEKPLPILETPKVISNNTEKKESPQVVTNINQLKIVVEKKTPPKKQSQVPVSTPQPTPINISQVTNITTPLSNPTPTVIQTQTSSPIEPVQPTPPTEIPFDYPFAQMHINAGPTYAGAFINYAKVGDIITTTFQGNTITQIVDKVTGSDNFYGVSLSKDLTPNSYYYYSLKLERGNQYAISSGSFQTSQ